MTPAVIAVTFRDTVQEPLPGRVPPESVTLAPPFAAVTGPPQELLRPFGVEMRMPAGRESVKPRPVRLLAFGFVILKLSEDVPFTGTTAGVKLLVRLGGQG